MFKRRGKTSMFKYGDSFSESALSSYFDEDTGTFDSYFSSEGSGTFWTDDTGGDTTTQGSYWTGGDFTNDTSNRLQQSPCFGDGFFRGPRGSETYTGISSDPGCINFIWESSSDEEENPTKLKAFQSRTQLRRRESNNDQVPDLESRDESLDIFQEAFSFVSNDKVKGTEKDIGRDELDSKLYNLLLGTGSNLIGIGNSGSAESGDGSRSLGPRYGLKRGSLKSTSRDDKPVRKFMAPWSRQRRRHKVLTEEKRENAPLEENSKNQRKVVTKSAMPFTAGLRKKKTSQVVSRKGPNLPPKPSRQTSSDTRLNDAIMVFSAEESPLPSTLPRSQSSKFVPSKELRRQMERNIDRESFVSVNDLPTPDALQHLPTLSGRDQSKGQNAVLGTHLLERQSSRRSNLSIAKSSNRSLKSKGNRSQLTRRSSKTTKSRKSHQKIPSNQLSFSDDDGNGFFSVGSLDA